jgi:hypothetical protein
MQTLEPIARRSSQIDVVERKRANATLKPFIGALMRWNSKTAHLRERSGSVYSSEQDRALARLESGALLAEIRHRHSDFRAAIKGEPPHGRLDDVDAAFRRLIGQLHAISDGHR